MSDTSTRNEWVRRFVAGWIAKAAQHTLTPQQKTDQARELDILKQLIPIPQNGFRGVVLTSIVGKAIDPSFRPLENFYNCSPRAIFEKGIYYALQEARIPCGKSDPLNVAKNIQKLDYGWAQGRRPESAARAAVDYIKLLEDAHEDKEKYYLLVLLYFHELYQFGLLVNSKNFELDLSIQTIPLQRALMLAKFVLECPEGGTIPQFIVGHLINLMRENDSRIRSVEGFRESVFGTNTTSKKPADVWEVTSDDDLGGIYEVTVKVIDHKRLDDCVDTLRQQGITDKVVTFICNLPHDTKALGIRDQYLSYKGVGFQFLDICRFIEFGYCMLDAQQQHSLIEFIQNFVFDPNRPIKTKEYWQSASLEGLSVMTTDGLQGSTT